MPIDRWIAGLAGRQRGNVARAQLLDAGIGKGAIDHRIARGRLHPQFPGAGVYLVGHDVAPPLSTQYAALLACGPEAVLSHRSAAALWGFLSRQPTEVDVTVPGRIRKGPKGIRVHSGSLTRAERKGKHGLAVTSPARTCRDLGEQLEPDQHERAIAEARVLKLVTDRQLRAAIAAAPSRPGSSATKRILDREDGPQLTRSEPEALVLKLVRAARLGSPRANATVLGYEVDLVWEKEKVIVEFDSWQFHSDRRSFERDRRKAADLQLAGYTVLQLTWRRLTEEPYAVVAQLAAALAT